MPQRALLRFMEMYFYCDNFSVIMWLHPEVTIENKNTTFFCVCQQLGNKPTLQNQIWVS